MNRSFGIVMAWLVLVVVSAFGQPPAGGEPAFHSFNYEQAMAKARRENKIVMIDFGAIWCGPCKHMEATTFKNRRVEKFLAENLIAIKIDIDNQPELSKKHGVTAVPTMLFLDGEAKELKRIVGAQSAEQLLDATAQFQKK